jgi:hypothetical protein
MDSRTADMIAARTVPVGAEELPVESSYNPGRVIAAVFWVVSLLCALGAIYSGIVDLHNATSAPQQAAAAAIACLIAIAPYVLARSVSELIRPH